MLKSAQKSQHIEWVTFVAMLKYELPNCTPAKFSHSFQIKELIDQQNQQKSLINQYIDYCYPLVYLNLFE